jgi:hypothetical protein
MKIPAATVMTKTSIMAGTAARPTTQKFTNSQDDTKG